MRYMPTVTAAVIGVLLALPGAAAGQDNATAAPLSVQEAIRIGLHNNYAIRVARTTAEIARNNVGLGTAGFLPRLDTRGSWRYDAVNERTGAPTSFGNQDTRLWNSAVQLDWTLFDGFRMFADRQRYVDLSGAGTEQARDRIETTVVEIMRSYFNLVQQEQLLDVARETRDISRTRLDREAVRQQLGGVSSTDLLNARVDYNQDQSALLDRKLAAAIAAKDLNILLARDPRTPIRVEKEITVPPLPGTFQELLDMARVQNSTLRTARYNLQAARAGVRIARSVFWPQLSLSGSYGYSDRSLLGQDVAPAADRTSRSIDAGLGLVLSFNLFNGGVDRINLGNARLEELNRQLELRQLEDRLAGLMRETVTTYHTQVEKVQLEAQNMDTARQNLERQKERYALGASDSLDFRDAQVNYAQAQVRLIVARFAARVSLHEIQQLTGRLEVF